MNKKLILILLATVLVFSSLFFLVSCGDEVSIDHLEIYSMPKTEYSLGESLDIEDAKLKVVYKDNTEKLVDITSSMLSGFDPNTLGVQYIKVYYENKSTVFTVTVSRSSVSGVELVIPDENVNYIEGQLLRTEGTYLQISFFDGSVERINVTREMCSGYDAYELGSQIISVVGYLDGVEYTSSFVVTVVERELTGIEVTTAPTKQIYYVGDSVLDFTGGVLFLKYDSGYSEYIDMADVNGDPIDGLEYSWNNAVVDNRSVVKVTYGDKETSFQIQVKVRDVSSYEVKADTVKAQMQNLDLDLTGMVVTINYNNGEFEEVTLPSDKISIAGYDNTLTGTQEVTIVFSYGGVELATKGSLTLEVTPREAVTLEMVTTPTIYQDTEFDVSEFELCIVYNNGERGEKFNLNNSMIIWANGIPRTSYAEEGAQSWYIVYRSGVELTYNFEVVGLEVTEIELNNANNVIAFLGGQAVTDDVRMTVTYNNGLVVENVSLAPEMVFDYDNQKTGLHKAKIKYVDKYEDGFITDLYLTVVREISSVTISGEFRTTYIVGQTFNPAGMILEVSYVGEGSSETIAVPTDLSDSFYDEWSFTRADGLTFDKVGQQIVYLENAGLVNSKEILVMVENKIVGIGPLYHKVDGVLKQVSGFEGEEVINNVGFGNVLEGVNINLENYVLFIDFESETDDLWLDFVKKDENESELIENIRESVKLDYNPKNTALGERKVTIFYENEGLVIMHETVVNVLEKSIVGIKLLATPDKTVYYQDENNLNGVGTEYEGMMLSIEYDNGTFGPINVQEAIAQSRLNIGNIDVREIGTKEVSFSYRTMEDVLYESSFFVTVVDSTPTSISWENGNVPYVELSLGSSFGVIGMGYIDSDSMIKPLEELELLVQYSGSNLVIPFTVGELFNDGQLVVEGYNANQTGIQDVRLVHVNNTSLYVTVKTKVVERTLKEIHLMKNGVLVEDAIIVDDESDRYVDKIEVIQSAQLDLTCLALQLVFSDDVKTIIPVSASFINASANNLNGYDANDATIGIREISISYTYENETDAVTTVVKLDVKEKSLLKIEINDIPKQFYIEHEAFDINSGSIMLYYDNGTTAIEELRNASTTNPSASFYVDINRFDNSEFTGYSKVQPISIRYGNCTTGFNVYMRDRRDVEVIFNGANVYTYTYGDVGFANGGEIFNPISITMYGYETYGASEAKKAINDYTIEYIPKAIWDTIKREENVDYTKVPNTVGEYVIVVSYNTNMELLEDAIHNAYEDSSKTLTILKKDIYVSFLKQSKVYGTATPNIYVIFSGTQIDQQNLRYTSLNDLFIEGDGLRTPTFNPEYETYYSTIAYLWGGNENGNPVPVVDENTGDPIFIDIFNIVYENKQTGISLEINDDTSVGTYNLSVENKFVSPNYNVIYQDVDFTIETRKVSVKPESISYAYGTETIPTIAYTTSKVKDENGQYIGDSGLFGNDVLIGNPRKISEDKVVGEYEIGLGSLNLTNNPNYDISIDNSDNPKVTIVPRNIYVKTDSVIKTYGEPFVEPQVKFFSDPACTMEEGAFASGDNLATIGTLVYPNTIDEKSAVNNYKYSCEIDKTGLGQMNYNVVIVSGYVEVVKRPVNVIATAISKVYGEQDPIIGFNITPIANESASGIVNNDVFEGALSRAEGDNYGEYAIQIGTLNNSNYDIRFTSATFSILRKSVFVYVSEEKLTKIYDGRLPSIDEYTLYESRESDATVYINDEVRDFITFSFRGESKGFGSYEVGVQVNSNNYSIALYNENGYSYTIEKRKVAITRNEFFDLPDGLEYKGSAYQFYAQISPNDLQHVYNNDGSYATDDNNKPLFDDPSVVLSIQSVINQGTYTVNVLELSDKNYEIDRENTEAITFTVLPRTIKVVIKTNAENNTIEREFNNQSAYLSAADYTLENLIPGEGEPYFNLGIYSGGKETNATDVYYDVNDGSIIGYDIMIAENSVDPNYHVVLAANYKYKIVPKDVVIRIYDKYLSKAYDGVEPVIKTSMFAPVSAVTGFDSNDVSFTFIREESDGRDNSSVGNYSVQIACMDRNFNVTTQQPNYVYQITPANVSVSINAQSLEKAYDGYDFTLDSDDLTFTAYYGNNLIVHNFRHKVGDDDPYQDFVDQLQTLGTAINNLDNQINIIDFTELSFAKTNMSTAILRANELMNLLKATNNPMQASNTVDMRSALETIISYLEDAIESINNDERETAVGYYRSITNTLMPIIKNVFDKEESYVAFIFGSESDNSAVEVGVHPFTVQFSDFNRNFTLLNSNKNVTISTHTLYINVPNIYKTYGITLAELGELPYELYDPRTGEVLEDGNFQRNGAPQVIGSFRNVGSYDVDVSSIYISEGGNVKSENYVLLPGNIGQVIIEKAILSIRINVESDPNLYVYGKTIERSQFSGQYVYLPGSSIPEIPTESYQYALIEEANAWAEANGYGNLNHVEKMNLYYGGLKFEGEDEFESVLKTNAVRYNCYLNGESGTEIFDTNIFDAGDYKLSATGFKADNYEIRVIPGTLTIAKRELTIYTQNGYYEKEYGEDNISYIYTNFAGNETANTLKVYRDAEGNGIYDTEVGYLSDMKWNYTVNEGEVNPLDPLTGASDTWLSINPNMGEYRLKNYTINFGTVSVIVVKAPLYCTLTPKSGVRVSSLYMAVPSDDSYEFTYTGLKNGENASDLIQTNPTIDFTNNGAFLDAGVHELGQFNLKTDGISLDNYDLKVESFQYEVVARKVFVSLKDVAPSVSTAHNTFSISPYMADIVYSKENGVTSAKIISGQYGFTNFVFEIEGDDVSDAIRNAFSKVSIDRLSKADAVFYETETLTGSTYTEVYRYTEMYKHSLTGTVDHDRNVATLKLSNMSTNSKNFKLEPIPFEATVYSSITSVIASIDQKLVASDLALTDEQINELITFTILKSSASWTASSVKEMLAKGTLSVTGSIPDVTSLNALMTYTLTDSAYNYSIKTALTDAYYTNYYSGTSNTNVVSVVDNRVETYDYSHVATCTMPIRFYPETTAVVYNPTLSDGAEYGKQYSLDSITTVTAQETLFNAMQLEFSIRPNANVKTPRLEIGFNADINGSKISLIFNYGTPNVVVIKVNNGTTTALSSYNIAYSNLFDGNMHEVRAYLDKENLTIILSVDGATGEMITLTDIIDSSNNAVISSVNDIVESSTLSLTLGGDVIVRKLMLSEQGLYDGVGAYISLPVESANVVKVNVRQENFVTTVSNLNALFGLTRMDASYEAVLHVDGQRVAYNATATRIDLANGIHLVEMALYKNGALVDYDYVYLRIVRQTRISYIDTLNPAQDPKECLPSTQIPLYTVSTSYEVEGNEDATLVSSGAINQYGYKFAGSRTQSDVSPYSYFNMSFKLDASATYDSVNDITNYLAGSYTTTFELFSSVEYGTVAGARDVGDTTYQGVALEMTREQTSNVLFGAENTAYSYNVVLKYYVNGRSSDIVVSTGSKECAYEVSVYKDRNVAHFGSNGIIVTIRSLYSADVNVYEFNDGDLNADKARIYPYVYGLGDRITLLKMSLEEEVFNYRDYLVNGQYESSNGSVMLEIDQSMTLIDNAGSALYSFYDNLVFNFNVDSNYTANSGDSITINVAESKLDGSGNGVKLVYDLTRNVLIFNFYRKGIPSMSQEWRLSGNVVGSHKLQVILDKNLTSTKANTFVGGDSGGDDLVYDGVEITATLGAKVHYTTVKVIMDGAENTFYMPLYDDLGCWKISTGNAYSNENLYSNVDGLTQTPTFLPIYSYTSVETNVDNVVAVDGYMVSKGANNTYTEGAITESPAI